MLSLVRHAPRRLAGTLTATPASAASALSAFSARAYTDDAGPSRMNYKKMQRHRLRENVAAGRTTTITDLSMLDAPAPAPRRNRNREREDRSDRGDRSDRIGGNYRGDRGERREPRERNLGSGGQRQSWGHADSRFEGPRFQTRRDRDLFYIDKKREQQGVTPKGERRRGPSPYSSSERVKKWIANHESPLTPKQVEEVIAMVAELPRESVNASVWNLVLALLGRERKYTVMWKTYNQMKKRGVHPNSRTFTTLLNAYAGIAHDAIPAGQFTPLNRPEKLTLDRVRLIYEQSQQHIGIAMRKSQPVEEDEDVGLSAADLEWPLKSPDAEEPEVDTSEVNVSPTNAYLKFLGRFGMWDEMKRVFVAMDTEGPLAPTQVTYTVMLMTARNIHALRRSKTANISATTLPDIDIGPTAKAYFEQAVRQFCGQGKPKGDRRLDEDLVLAALQCLAVGRVSDQRLMEDLISAFWGLASPRSPSVASATGSDQGTTTAPALPAIYTNLPRFKLTVRSATTLMSLLARSQNRSVAAHYTHLILDTRSLQPDLDLFALRSAVYVFANAQDINAVRSVMDMYQPPTGKDGWPMDVWHAALRAARWSADWEAALGLFRRMVHLPLGVERGEKAKAKIEPYRFTPPNGRPVDARRRPWIPPAAHRADAGSMSTLIKAAVACGLKQVREALAILDYYGEEQWWIVPRVEKGRQGQGEIDLVARAVRPGDLTRSERRAVAERVELAKDVMDAAERLLPASAHEEKEHLGRFKDLARAVTRNCAGVEK